MTWRINISRTASRQIDQFDGPIRSRLLKFLRERLMLLDDPRSIGEALQGDALGAFWKYRVGDYRLIATIEDRILTITVVRVAHRREAYR